MLRTEERFLIMNGYLVHILYESLENVRQNGVFFACLSTYTTYELVLCVFGPLKSFYSFSQLEDNFEDQMRAK